MLSLHMRRLPGSVAPPHTTQPHGQSVPGNASVVDVCCFGIARHAALYLPPDMMMVMMMAMMMIMTTTITNIITITININIMALVVMMMLVAGCQPLQSQSHLQVVRLPH